MLKKYKNTPAHLLLDNTAYFITASIYQKRNLLALPSIKERLITTIQTSFASKNWQLKEWVILNDHYHLLAISDKGTDLSKIMGKIHTQSGQYIYTETHADKPIWWNYWDYCPRNEKDYFTRLNYLFNNPIKHGLVANLIDYPYSSFHIMLEKQGREKLINQFRQYPDYKTLQLDED